MVAPQRKLVFFGSFVVIGLLLAGVEGYYRWVYLPSPVRIAVSFEEHGLHPHRITVKKDSRVVLAFSGQGEVTEVAIEQYNLHIPIPAGSSVTRVFAAERVGTFPIHCSRHGGEADKIPCGELMVVQPGQLVGEHAH